MQTTRRQFMKDSGSLVLGATAIGAAAPAPLLASRGTSAANRPTLVAIYLRGGADALNTIIPFTDKRYAEVRPTIAVAGPDSSDEHRGLPLDNRFAFNPNLKALHALYEKGHCAPIMCVGSPHPTRSHFDAQDFMERAAPGLKYVMTGWLNRYLTATQSSTDSNLRAFSLQPLLPRSLRGEYPVLARPDKKAEQALDVFEKVYRDSPMMNRRPTRGIFGREEKQAIHRFGVQTISQLRELNELLEAGKTEVKYPGSAFGKQMREIATVIKAERGLEVTALDYRGWDHHYNEGPIDGALGNRLADLSDSLGAFVEDLGPRMDRVMILVMSEFGRTVKENGNNGTDHGHGGFMLAIGNMVNGKQVYGQWTSLADNDLYQKRDLPAHTDFRVVFAETLQRVFDFDGIKEGFFPEYTLDAPPLEFLRQV